MNYKNILKTQENLIKTIELHDPDKNNFLKNACKFKIGPSLGFLCIEQEYCNPETHKCRYIVKNGIYLSNNKNLDIAYDFKYQSTTKFRLPLPNNNSYWNYDKDNNWYEYKYVYNLDKDYHNKFIHFYAFKDYSIEYSTDYMDLIRIESHVISMGTQLELTIVSEYPFSSTPNVDSLEIYMNIYNIVGFEPTNRDNIDNMDNKEFSEWICSDELEIIKRSGTMSTTSIEHWLNKPAYYN